MFVKTFRERRSWLSVYRTFYRVLALHVVLFHLTVAQVSVVGVGGGQYMFRWAWVLPVWGGGRAPLPSPRPFPPLQFMQPKT